MHLGCWENTQKSRKSLAFGSWFTSFSRVLPTSRVVYHAGKPIEIIKLLWVYRHNKPWVFNQSERAYYLSYFIKSYNELGLINKCLFKRGYFITRNKKPLRQRLKLFFTVNVWKLFIIVTAPGHRAEWRDISELFRQEWRLIQMLIRGM